MRYLKKTYLALLATCMHSVCLGQIQSMGFTQKIEIFSNPSHMMYYPKLQLLNDTLFVCSNTGIYQKDLLHHSDWKLYAFENVSIIDFVRNENKILANAMSMTNERDSLLLLSRDGGKSYVDYTNSCFRENGKNHIHWLAQNPLNPNSILTIDHQRGVFRSPDFGTNWENLSMYYLFDIEYFDYHPLDTTMVFYCGSGVPHNGLIYKSSDSGYTWAEYEVPGGDNWVYHVEFHPSDPNILFFGAQGKIGKSIDKGETWEVKELRNPSLAFYKVIFDTENPDVLYAFGPDGHYKEDTIFVYRSTDVGESWHLAYKEYTGIKSVGLIDMVKHKDKLIFYTEKRGLLKLDTKTTPLLISDTPANKTGINFFFDTQAKLLHFETDKTINKVEIIDSAGNIILHKPIGNKEKTVEVASLHTGIYIAVVYTDEQVTTKKIVVGR